MGGVPPGRGRLAGETVAGHRRNYDIERIGCISAVCGGIGQRIDDLHLFGDRAGPSVRHDQRQRIFVFRADVDEVNVQSIDLGQELRQGVQFRLDLAPVIFCRPVARQRLRRRELYSLSRVCNRLSFRELCRVDAPAQFGQFGFRNIHMEGANGGLVGGLVGGSLCGCRCGHGLSPFEVDFWTFNEAGESPSLALRLRAIVIISSLAANSSSGPTH